MRMESFLKKFHLLSDKQFGLREKVSTQDAIGKIVGVYNTMDHSLPSICVFIDLVKAFDTISHQKMLTKLWDIGFRGKSHELKSYLHNRMQTVLYGLPQGTILGPTLFNIYLNNLLTLPLDCQIVSFADDTAVFFSEPSWEILQQAVSKNIKITKDWFDKHLFNNQYKQDKIHALLFLSMPPPTIVKNIN